MAILLLTIVLLIGIAMGKDALLDKELETGSKVFIILIILFVVWLVSQFV